MRVSIGVRAVCLQTMVWTIIALAGDMSWGLDPPLTLESQLQDIAPRIIQELRNRGITRIGVLKFRVQKPGDRPSDNEGTLNMFVADRLEAALALANPNEPEKCIQLVRQASRTAANIRGASHLSKSGCERLFSASYPPAWGTEAISVDAFLTGMLQFAPDYKSFSLGILAVRRGNPELQLLLPPVQIAATGIILHESGESFQVRSILDDFDPADPADSVQQIHEAPETHFPLNNNPAVTLRIFYDNRPVKLEFRNGQAVIPEPPAGTAVKMQLERMDQTNCGLGIVLKVNGENTLYRERLRDVDCAKWVLTPQRPKGTIYGFRIPHSERVEEFRVASVAESKKLEMNYGADVGTISIVVFQGQPAGSAATNPKSGEFEDSPDLAAIMRAQFPTETPANAESLKSQLLGVSSRGLILPGAEKKQSFDEEHYAWEPEPIMSAVINYYTPKQTPETPVGVGK